MVKEFRKQGLRRDLNFSDIPNPIAALNNLLDKLIDKVDATFIYNDLDCIRNISSIGLDNEGFLRFVNNEEQVTSPSGTIISSFPIKTYQNRLDITELFSGVPRIQGGNGLNASYFNDEQVDATDTTVQPDGTVRIFEGNPQVENNFWEDGDFDWNGKLVPDLSGFAGGIEWEGYFIPKITGAHTFTIYQTSCAHIDFQAEAYSEDQYNNGNQTQVYQAGKRINVSTTIPVKVVDTGTLVLVNSTLPAAGAGASGEDEIYVGEGLVVSGSNINGDSVVDSINENKTSNNGGRISVTPGTVTGTAGDQFNLTLKKTLGQEDNFTYTTYILEKYRPYRIKLKYFIPTEVDGIPFNARRMDKTFNINVTEPMDVSGSDDLRYTRLYNLGYDFTDKSKGNLFKFLDNSILSGGGSIGSASGGGTGYVKVKSNKKVDVKYKPKTKISDPISGITRATVVTSTTQNVSIATTSSTSGIEIGNKVFGPGVPNDTEVKEIIINEGFFLTRPFNTTASNQTLKIIDHRGFVKKTTGTCSGTTITLTSHDSTGTNYTSDLKSGMVVIGNDGTNGDFTDYTGITTSGSTNTVTIPYSKTVDQFYVTIYGPASSLSPVHRVRLASGTYTFTYDSTDVGTNTTGNALVVGIRRYTVGALVTDTGVSQIYEIKVEEGPYDPDLYFYEGKGLLNYSLNTFCATGSGGQEVECLTAIANASTSTNRIQVSQDDYNKISTSGWKGQGSIFLNGETSVTPVLDGGNYYIQANENLVKDISSGANFTVTTYSDTRILCCPPTDTSPPFVAVESGLETTTTNRILRIDKGNLIFDKLIAPQVHSSKLEDESNTSNWVSNRYIEIQTGVTAGDPTVSENIGTKYKILCEA
tara:strand:- start:8630 stop:11236 length:2607 start_codon:yes stop_codon:yes gene_type:complete